MASGSQRRTRSERVAALELPPGQWERAWISLSHRDVLGRAAMALAASAAICVIIRAWDPPFSWRINHVPGRYVTARVPFRQEDLTATEVARQRARSNVRYVFAQDPQPLVRLRAKLRTTVAELTKAETLTDSSRALWREFRLAEEKTEDKTAPRVDTAAEKAAFAEFRKALVGKENLDLLERIVADAFGPLEEFGVLGKPLDQLEKGNLEEIVVYPVGNPELRRFVRVSDVLFDKDKQDAIHNRLRERLKSKAVADHVFAWLQFHLLHPEPTSTLVRDKEATAAAQEEAVRQVEPVFQQFSAGDPIINNTDVIEAKQLELLRLEHQAYLSQRGLSQRLARTAAVLTVVFSMFILCGVYMRYRQRGPLASLTRLSGMMLLAVAAVAASLWASNDPWRAEVVPLLLFSMIMAIVYRQELALLLSGMLAWIIVVGLGRGGMPVFLLLLGTTAATTLSLGRIRSRSKLIYVGLFAGCVAMVLYVMSNMIENQPLGMPLLREAVRQGLWTLAAGFLMTGLLPFVERIFGVLTDLSLLELGDITHPLLQELVRRAPSTYNHSITVGSIGEAAADAIGARGLLVRVGAYFHDIGKMLKPGYFVENQGEEGSRHESLVPAMSTLVIIAHIKDGYDLARQHRLPQPITDLIQQHHGTMLMEYFFDRAHEKKGSDPNGGEVDENLFRYPGPKPQTKEAAVLMLADAVESASRTLVNPNPARIESLVRDLAQRRLQGGQFDESGLTLRELGTIERSLVMSVASIYHGRLKYPEQRSA
jgi:putative nucleotidyltransferase with HDIG domain